MAGDSAITKRKGGSLVTIDHKGWAKVLKVPRMRAGISYWGTIGLITTERFDVWLQRRIKNGHYNDLAGFADYLAADMKQGRGRWHSRSRLSAWVRRHFKACFLSHTQRSFARGL
jgi:hypothetical protein